jgi:hypothetical protein
MQDEVEVVKLLVVLPGIDYNLKNNEVRIDVCRVSIIYLYFN